jgi:hypothetical protein
LWTQRGCSKTETEIKMENILVVLFVLAVIAAVFAFSGWWVMILLGIVHSGWVVIPALGWGHSTALLLLTGTLFKNSADYSKLKESAKGLRK